MEAWVTKKRPMPYVGTDVTVATRYWLSPVVIASTAAAAVTADRFYAQPFNLPGLTIDRIGLETTVGAGNAKIGLYANNNGIPGALLVDGGTIDVSGAAIVEATIAATLLPEWCWVGIIFSGTPTVRTGASGSTSVLGCATPAAGAARGYISTGAQTYAGGLPVTGPAVSFIATVPCLVVRKT